MFKIFHYFQTTIYFDRWSFIQQEIDIENITIQFISRISIDGTLLNIKLHETLEDSISNY